MSQSIIKVDGYVANEPQLGATPDGTPVLGLSVPHQRSQKNEQTGGWDRVGPTTWHSVSVFGDQAKALAPHVGKGTHVLVEGFAEVRPYSTKEGAPAAEILVRRAKVAVIPSLPRQEHQPAPQQWASQPEQDAWAAPGLSYGDDTPF
ncbi:MULTISPECIES: single-stranded DNA-binding protein [unclassified Microbacterium]|uniref:single-stranded DNA-binding protein n=1 Tax=unclassified Microbacterium TaxID=2609290 RepID=UPI003019CE3F